MKQRTIPEKRRVLTESTNTNSNIQSPATKRLKTDGPTPRKFKPPPKIANGAPKSSQPSQFEEEILQNLTQGISNLKDKNAEKDQRWARPSLDGFNPQTETLCFQQIEAEEGTFGGKHTIKLFGVTEVLRLPVCHRFTPTNALLERKLGPASCYGLRPLSLHSCSHKLHTG